jgi:hypothetical protein
MRSSSRLGPMSMRLLNRWTAVRSFATGPSGTQPTTSAAAAAQKAGGGAQPDAAVYEVNEANFMKEAIEASDKRVILIDCYAEYVPSLSLSLTPLCPTDLTSSSSSSIVLIQHAAGARRASSWRRCWRPLRAAREDGSLWPSSTWTTTPTSRARFPSSVLSSELCR